MKGLFMRKRLLFTPLFIPLLLALFLIGSTGQALAVIVTPAAPDGWAPANVRADATVAITTAQPRSGNGSLEFTTNTVTPGQDKADFQKLWNATSFPTRTLAGLTALSYEYYRASSSTTANHLAPVLRLYVVDATVGSPTFGKYALLIWEPVYNGAAPIPTDQWISQDILNGNFWMFVPGGQSIPSGVVQNYNTPLSGWLAGGVTGQPGDPPPINIDANTLVFGVNVGVGSGWGGTFRGFVDNVTLRWGTDEVHANFEVDHGLGDLTINKVVDWSGAPPATGQSFEICITGPSYPKGDCQTTSGGAVTWSGLQVGDYTVSESDPGPNWSVTLPGVVSVSSTQPAQATVTNTLRPGALIVEKIIDWQGVTPIPGVIFSICISGPSYPTPFCQNTSGGALTFGPLVPGSYTVSEAPDSHWVTTITSSPVEVAPLQSAQVTVHNKYVGPALECPLLDDFNRANTTSGLGRNWTGATNTYRINANQAQPLTTAGTIFWNQAPRVFGADQVACMQLATIDPHGKHHTLILKAQATNDYTRGMILVAYDAVNQRVVVETIQPGQSGWATQLVIPGPFANGDVLGARALADGSVRVYKNGVLIGAGATSNFFVNRGGRIGAWYFQTPGARFDDFGGGNTPASMVSSAAGETLSEDADGLNHNLYLPAVQR